MAFMTRVYDAWYNETDFFRFRHISVHTARATFIEQAEKFEGREEK
jgi:hypothetical protein